MSTDPTAPQDVREHLNIIERLVDGASSSDEYFEAIIRNQAMMIALMEGGGSGSPDIGSFGVPTNTAGIAVQGASEGDLAEFLYKTDGRTVIDNFEVASDIADGEVATINSDGELQPTTGVAQGDLDFGNIATSTSNAGGFIYQETEQDATLQPGDTEVILEVNLNNSAAWYMTGTNDETYTSYDYKVDGESILGDPIPKPLGLYNNMFEFPEPLQVNNTLEVEVSRNSSAPGSDDYFSNVVLL